MKISLLSILLFCVMYLTGCASPNIYHFNTILSQQDDAKAIDVYLDAYGMVYPKTGIAPAYMQEPEYNGELKSTATNPESTLCKSNIGGDLAKLCEGGKKNWGNTQTVLWQNIVDETSRRFNPNSSKRALVVLIHGFNVDAPQRDYRIAKARIRDVVDVGTDIVFVQFHWDGSKGPVKTKAWSKAQYTGPLVGFRMREFYNLFNAKTFNGSAPSVHVLTHSSGAFLTAATFGNPASSLPRLTEQNGKLDDYYEFKNHLTADNGKWAIPTLPSLSVGMLAPALPSDAFTGYVKEIPNDGPLGVSNYIPVPGGGFYAKDRGWLAPNSQITFSINPKDRALSNLGLISANTSILGAKGVGAKLSTFCFIDHWSKVSDTTVLGLDFNRTHKDKENGIETKSHDFADYLTQTSSTEFLVNFLRQKSDNEHQLSCDTIDQ